MILLSILRFFWPPLEVTVPSPPSKPEKPQDKLRGYRDSNGTLVIVTDLGVELPIRPDSRMLVIDVIRLISQIELLPEVTGPSEFVW